MTKFELALKALQLAIAAADALQRAREVYDAIAEQAKRDSELTPEQAAALDEKAKAIFASPASHPSGR